MQPTADAKRETLNIRIKAEVRDLIDRAAKSRGKNRTDFILESACTGAEDAYRRALVGLTLPAKPWIRKIR